MSTDGPDSMIIHKIPHYQQRCHWDCGVTCVLMLLEPHHRQQLLSRFSEICQEEGFHQSTWTIDLCYLLMRFGVPHTMYTTMMGVNENHKKYNYYSKIIDLDRSRIQRRFESAPARGIAVWRGALDARALRRALARGPALLLVDAARLNCDLCKHNRLRFEFRRWLGGGYRGHYIVCVGARGSLVLFRDPARPARACAACAARAGRASSECAACAARSLCAAPLQRVLAAHTAPGTDCDAILIHRSYK